MSGGRYPDLALAAYDVVEAFAHDWRARPYFWWTEADVHFELAARLRRELAQRDKGEMRASYDGMFDDVPHVWSRVACKPRVRVGGEMRFPDLVLWQDVPGGELPDKDGLANWPIHWCCEIKHRTSLNAENAYDLEKLRKLVEQGDLAYGCWLQLRMQRGSSSDLEWEKHVDRRLWILDVSVPARAL